MDKYKNLKRARHHMVFLAALVFGSIFIYFLNNLDLRKQGLGVIEIERVIAPDLNVSKKVLTAYDMEVAKTAWHYFENNYHEETGLVSSVDNFPSTTLWDTGNYLMALIAAEKLALIDASEYDKRMRTALTTLGKIELYRGVLPNKVYNASTLAMTDYANVDTKDGIGWSAIDIGRILIPMAYVQFNQPEYHKELRQILMRWNVREMTKQGALYGAVVEDGNESLLQEGRLGYEQYTSKMFATFGVDITNALRYDKYLEFIDIYDIEVPYDKRDKAHSDANNYVVMEPYMLDGLEFGWDYFSKEFSYRLYEAQRQRYKDTKILTAVTEDHLDQAPYFVYNNVYVNKDKWAAIDEHGNLINEMKQLSTKASFAMDALYDSNYTKKLVDALKPLQSDRGWYTGIYEKDNKINKSLTCNTNAIVLESILYKQEGPLLKMIQNQ
ncbi:MAG: FIG01060252: hypothetical protein [uncultured Sulfurovum sp.]|uniref:DUF3131 domain-containing protein n=1 Tax=uncultured Sulfurovum sp. TaxID=269237 RepID=A0A6S6S2M0_9BACT|nr:MAG: FIG01060252: hypothetical protein [uncultured Sulfurovum sp.]